MTDLDKRLGYEGKAVFVIRGIFEVIRSTSLYDVRFQAFTLKMYKGNLKLADQTS